MMWKGILLLSCLIVFASNTDLDPEQFLEELNGILGDVYSKYVFASWEFSTNITEHNKNIMVKRLLDVAKRQLEAYQNASKFDTSDMTVDMKRQFMKIMDIGISAQRNQTKLARLQDVIADMKKIYSTGKVCLEDNKCLELEPDIVRLMKSSRNESELLKVWKGWRDATGRKMKDLYAEFVSLSNDAISYLGFKDTGEYWKSQYDSPEFEIEIQELYDELQPFYEQLHAYTRRHLKKIYGDSVFPKTGHIPAHLLGNMWAQQWNSLSPELMPFKNKTPLDVSNEMVRQNYTALKIFKTADDFFRSLGLIEMPDEFWKHSLLEKPKGREVVCHASASDFYNGKDFRVKMCTDITMESLETAHHEMGHIEYYLLYKHLPVWYRDGANPGFHEAVGDVMSLSVQTPKHMHSIGLLPGLTEDIESDINFLMEMALQRFAFLPFGFLIDRWRWSVFRGSTRPDQYNEYWWDLRCRYQGVSPPVSRSSDDFDPGAKYHIPSNTPYIRYFVSMVIQFQFHKAACKAANHQGPLHRCDIYDSAAAGDKLRQMLSLGSSKPSMEAMKIMTGQTKMSAKPLLEYFEPLVKFLKAENGKDHGWDVHCPESHNYNSSSCHCLLNFRMFYISIHILFVYMNNKYMY